jgi:hypothetical protein
MKKIIFTLMIGLFFSGCFTSSLEFLDNGEFVLNYDSNRYHLTSNIVSKESLNFKDLLVTQYKLQTTRGDILFYEDAHTGLDFEFNFGGLYTVLYVFNNAQKYESVLQKNNLVMLQVKFDKERYVNLILQESDTQVYSYVYGFSNEEFLKIAKTVSSNKNNIKLKYEGVTFNKDSKNITNWNDELVYFTPLITPLRVVSRM